MVSACFGDVDDAGQAQEPDRGVAEGGHDVWGVAGADLGVVFVVGDVTGPVQTVFDAPSDRVPSQRVSVAGRR